MANNYFTKERHRIARQMREYHRKETGEDAPYSSFLRKYENPLYEQISFYEVTFDLSYKKKDYEFKIEQETFFIAVPKSAEADIYIQENTKQQVADKFMGKGKEFVYNQLNVDVNKYNDLRGVEKNTTKSFEDIDFNQLISSGKYVETSEVQVKKNKKGVVQSDNTYNLGLWF